MTSCVRILAPAALAVAAAAIGFAPVAAASPESFLDEININNAGIPGYTPSQQIAAGYQTCSQLKGGASVLDTMSAVESQYHFNQGTLFVSAASTNLCPDWSG